MNQWLPPSARRALPRSCIGRRADAPKPTECADVAPMTSRLVRTGGAADDANLLFFSGKIPYLRHSTVATPLPTLLFHLSYSSTKLLCPSYSSPELRFLAGKLNANWGRHYSLGVRAAVWNAHRNTSRFKLFAFDKGVQEKLSLEQHLANYAASKAHPPTLTDSQSNHNRISP